MNLGDISLFIEAVFMLWWGIGLCIQGRFADDKNTRIIANLLALLAILIAVVSIVII